MGGLWSCPCVDCTAVREAAEPEPIEPERVEGWLNIYATPDPHYGFYPPAVGHSGVKIYAERIQADYAASGHSARDRIACIKVSFEKGEGL